MCLGNNTNNLFVSVMLVSNSRVCDFVQCTAHCDHWNTDSCTQPMAFIKPTSLLKYLSGRITRIEVLDGCFLFSFHPLIFLPQAIHAHSA